MWAGSAKRPARRATWSRRGCGWEGLLATLPLVIAVVVHRFFGPADLRFSALDEFGPVRGDRGLLVTGYSWQIKSTTFFGGRP